MPLTKSRLETFREWHLVTIAFALVWITPGEWRKISVKPGRLILDTPW